MDRTQCHMVDASLARFPELCFFPPSSRTKYTTSRSNVLFACISQCLLRTIKQNTDRALVLQEIKGLGLTALPSNWCLEGRKELDFVTDTTAIADIVQSDPLCPHTNNRRFA